MPTDLGVFNGRPSPSLAASAKAEISRESSTCTCFGKGYKHQPPAEVPGGALNACLRAIGRSGRNRRTTARCDTSQLRRSSHCARAFSALLYPYPGRPITRDVTAGQWVGSPCPNVLDEPADFVPIA